MMKGLWKKSLALLITLALFFGMPMSIFASDGATDTDSINEKLGPPIVVLRRDVNR